MVTREDQTPGRTDTQILYQVWCIDRTGSSRVGRSSRYSGDEINAPSECYRWCMLSNNYVDWSTTPANGEIGSHAKGGGSAPLWRWPLLESEWNRTDIVDKCTIIFTCTPKSCCLFDVVVLSCFVATFINTLDVFNVLLLLHRQQGNPFAPVVPCHRVVMGDLTIGGFRCDIRIEKAKTIKYIYILILWHLCRRYIRHTISPCKYATSRQPYRVRVRREPPLEPSFH